MSDKSWTDLQLVRRYRASTVALHRSFCASDSREAIEDRLASLSGQQWLTRTVLFGQAFCYALGVRGQRLFAVHQYKGFPFGQAALLQHLGIASFCAAAEFKRLLPDEFHENYPHCHRPGLPDHSYCQDGRNRSHVAWCIVDHGSQAFRLYAKVARVLNARLALPAFHQVIAEQRFQIVTVTATPEKARRIQAAFDDQPALAVPHSVVSVPELLPFLF